MGRSSYASKDKDKRTEDLAAGLETSAIEYAAELILHIDGNPKQQVEIRCAKNRYTGDLFKVPCRCDFPTATFHELDVNALEQEKEQANEVEFHEAKKAIITEITRNSNLSPTQIVKAVVMRRTLVLAALKSLKADKAIKCDPGPRNAMLWSLA